MLPKKLHKKLEERIKNNTLRSLGSSESLIDFSSNDYLGFAFAKAISTTTTTILNEHDVVANGATGSRLLSGNHTLYTIAESTIADFHESETALICNSGYDANIGFFQSVPQRGDIILYDEFIHASIRDGMTMSHAKGYKFKHNNVIHLEQLLLKYTEMSEGQNEQEIYVITESVFSMDGDSPDLASMCDVCHKYKAKFIIDEAHATGVIGNKGQGLVQALELDKKIFARIITFGKALGAHGAAILCDQELRDYLINFARSFIYTTALPPHSIATIIAAYEFIALNTATIEKLQTIIEYFNRQLESCDLNAHFISSDSAIHCAIIPGNDKVKSLSRKLKQHGYDVKPILSPTVAEGQERLRFCLHSFNTQEEIVEVLCVLKEMIPKFT
ncbi:pyridoxal phosphate-dependent aminotransferase family protein [Dokdonia sp.]|uniref:aminotransferase class I/II-fold pyridoxal phosphate-dependent enzyme n=1 Tax=Dokdonia sp. TaxID=2024995 RepID=UPI003266B7B3